MHQINNLTETVNHRNVPILVHIRTFSVLGSLAMMTMGSKNELLQRLIHITELQHARQPSWLPASQPSWLPACQPSWLPASQPSWLPASQPSWRPASQPSWLPACQPSWLPASQPSWLPASQPIPVGLSPYLSSNLQLPSCSSSCLRICLHV